LSAAPWGNSPVAKNRHRAIRTWRATATIPMRRQRFPPPPKHSRNQPLKALSGCSRPTPRQLRGHPAPMAVARLGHAWFSGPGAAVIRRWRSSCSASPLTARLHCAPAKQGPHHPPCPLAPEAFALPELTPLLARGRWRTPQSGPTVGGQRRQLLPQARVRRVHAQPTPTEATRGEANHPTGVACRAARATCARAPAVPPGYGASPCCGSSCWRWLASGFPGPGADGVAPRLRPRAR
jgi:hypothetical protein